MDQIEKLLNKLSNKEKSSVKNIITQILSNNLVGLDVKKLVGAEDLFRVRKGGVRVIFSKEKSNISIISIQRRNEKNYKKI